jgi:hypothetical protein
VGLFVRSADDQRATTPSEPATPPAASTAAPSDGNPPSWIISELPPAHAEIALKIEALRRDAQKYEGVAGVLWQVGQPLAEGIRDIFQELKFETTLTRREGGHNIRVDLGSDRRLIVEVAGAAEAIERKAPAITELLRLLQEEAGDKDRLVLAVNAWCNLPLDARKSDLITPDALKLAQRVGAAVVASSTLYGIWKYSLTDLDAARQSIMRLYSHDGGIFK